MASASEKSPRGAGDLHTGMNEIEITGFASRTTDSSDANSEARFRGGHSHGLFASAAPAPRSPRRQEGPQDLVPSQAGLFPRPAPEADHIARPAPHHQDLSSTRKTSWFRLSSLVLSSLARISLARFCLRLLLLLLLQGRARSQERQQDRSFRQGDADSV